LTIVRRIEAPARINFRLAARVFFDHAARLFFCLAFGCSLALARQALVFLGAPLGIFLRAAALFVFGDTRVFEGTRPCDFFFFRQGP
jgi:small basic protein